MLGGFSTRDVLFLEVVREYDFDGRRAVLICGGPCTHPSKPKEKSVVRLDRMPSNMCSAYVRIGRRSKRDASSILAVADINVALSAHVLLEYPRAVPGRAERDVPFLDQAPYHPTVYPVKRARHALVHRVAWASKVRGRVPRVPPVNAYYRRRHMCAVISERIERRIRI